jgi:hypothetical protein
MENTSANWQDSLDIRLLNRLHRPSQQPGLMKMAMAQHIINRCDRFLNRLPLLSQQIQRWGSTNISTNLATSDSVPIVYVQPISTTTQPEIGNTSPSDQSSVLVIQRKIDSSARYDVSDAITPSLPLKTQPSQTNISSSENPVVTPKIISEDLTNTSEMSLQAKFIDSNTSLSHSSIFPVNEINTLNQTNISSSEIPVVTPQIISEDLTSNSEMPLQAKFIDSNTSLSHSSIFPVNEINTLNQTNISSSENPVVISQIISENSSFPKLSYTSKQPLPTIQVKPQKFSPYPSALVPIITVQPLNDEQSFKDEQTSLMLNLSNYQNNHQSVKGYASLPLVSAIPPTNFNFNSQSLPLYLAKNHTQSKPINHQTHLSNLNSASSPRIITNPSLTKETSISTTQKQAHSKNIDIDTIATQVERKIMRRLVIESERRGKIR